MTTHVTHFQFFLPGDATVLAIYEMTGLVMSSLNKVFCISHVDSRKCCRYLFIYVLCQVHMFQLCTLSQSNRIIVHIKFSSILDALTASNALFLCSFETCASIKGTNRPTAGSSRGPPSMCARSSRYTWIRGKWQPLPTRAVFANQTLIFTYFGYIISRKRRDLSIIPIIRFKSYIVCKKNLKYFFKRKVWR